MFFKRALQKIAVNFTQGTPDPYFVNLSENVYTHIVFRRISSAFEEANYDKNIHLTHLFMYCSGVVLAAYRKYHKNNNDPQRDKKILHAINHFNFNNIYQKVIDGFGFGILKNASSYFMNITETYACGLEDGNTFPVVSMFLENLLIDKYDAISTNLMSIISDATENAIIDSLKYFETGRMPYNDIFDKPVSSDNATEKPLQSASNPKIDIKYPGKGGFQLSGAHISLSIEKDDIKLPLPLTIDDFENHIDDFIDKFISSFLYDDDDASYDELVIFAHMIPAIQYGIILEVSGHTPETILVYVNILINKIIDALPDTEILDIRGHILTRISQYEIRYTNFTRTRDSEELVSFAGITILGTDEWPFCLHQLKEIIDTSHDQFILRRDSLK